MPYRKILFLDIDGVVLPDRADLLPNQTKPFLKVFDPCAVSLLNDICHRKRYKIVIHSSWLKHHPPGETLAHCIAQGIKKGHFHDTEPECTGQLGWRYDRIDEWLSRHKEVTKYVILDDIPPNEGYQRADKWVCIDPEEGITMQVYREILARR